MRSWWILLATCVLLLAPRSTPASPCAAECIEQGKAFGWSRAARKACRTACKQEQRACKQLARGDRADCRARNRDCAGYCATSWADSEQVQDRSFCQTVCSSCYRSGTEFCLEVNITNGFIARCCGGAGQPTCCPQANPGFNQCVDLTSDADNCGSCGHPCDASLSQVCVGSICTALPSCPGGCATGLTCCATDTVGGGHCVDLATDHANCRVCGMPCDANQACQGGSCTAACVAPPFVVPCQAAGPVTPSCCAAEEKCCPGDYGINSCWSPDRVNADNPFSGVITKDDIQCCQTPEPPPFAGSITRGCPITYSCCFATTSGGVSSCCPPGFGCAANGTCEPP